MFAVGPVELLVLAVAVIGLLVVAVVRTAWIEADLTKIVPADAAQLQGPVRRLLASVPGQLIDTGVGTFTLVVRRRPVWMFLVILLTLPFGLLFLLVKEAQAVQVTLVPQGGDTQVRIVGRTSKRVLQLLDHALDPARAGEVSVR